jgi:hypothetical protein
LFSGTTPRTPRLEKKILKNNNRNGMLSDEEIEENLSYIEENSKVMNENINISSFEQS